MRLHVDKTIIVKGSVLGLETIQSIGDVSSVASIKKIRKKYCRYSRSKPCGWIPDHKLLQRDIAVLRLLVRNK